MTQRRRLDAIPRGRRVEGDVKVDVALARELFDLIHRFMLNRVQRQDGSRRRRFETHVQVLHACCALEHHARRHSQRDR